MMRTLVAAGLALAACSPALREAPESQAPVAELPPQEPLQPAAAWSCEDGRKMTVTFYGERVTLVFVDGRALDLPAVIAASGEAYEADAVRFHAKGGEEAYLAEGEIVTNCKRDASE
jgi:membrane-bound inhibitor of C-type lysozyme